jgi:hypothetical protein
VKVWVCLMILWPGLALAEGADPFPLVFFTGQYRMIGTSPAGPVDQALRLEPQGADLAVILCGAGDGGRLVMPSQLGADHYIEGRIGAEDVVCDPFMTYENTPLLACYSETGSLLTLWPGVDFAAPLDCGA